MGAQPTSRIARRQLHTRTRLLESGYRLMSVNGVDAATINEITEGADVGFGTFYNYFDSKEALAEQALDCVIDNMGRRNDLVNEALAETEPARIVATSVRLVARQMLTDPMWRWWVAHPDLVVDRMREGFRPYGHRDFHNAIGRGQFQLELEDVEMAWGHLNWMLAGGVKDILDGRFEPRSEGRLAQAILRMFGVPADEAIAATAIKLPAYPDLPIDFGFRSAEKDLT